MADPRAAPAPWYAVEEERENRKTAYNQSWSRLLDELNRRLQAGGTLADLVKANQDELQKYAGFIPATLTAAIPQLDLGEFSGQKPPYRLAVVNGSYTSVPRLPGLDILVRTVAALVDSEVDCVVELGSGPGYNLGELFLALPPGQRRPALIACEPSEQGRRLTEQLFSTTPGAEISTRPFDYYEPDLGFLAAFKKVVVFTSHSIEQIPILGPGLYESLLAAPVCACVHQEPIGWQRYTNLAASVRKLHDDEHAWNAFRSNFIYSIQPGRETENAAAWAAGCVYNTDLLPVLARASDQGHINLTALAYDFASINPFNPSTLVSWTRA